ncbi:MAG: hypothetical protein ABL958_16645, partial [Bdellovibrionia bacterium]
MSARAVPRKVAMACLLVFPLSALFFSHVKLDETLYQIFPPKHEFTRGLAALEDTKGWIANVSLVADTRLEIDEMEKLTAEVTAAPFAKEQVAFHENASTVFNWFTKENLFPKEGLIVDFQSAPIY